MLAYLLLIVAVLSRVLPHPAWFNFTAVGGMLLYFGARRPLREMLAPLTVLVATDFYLTVFAYGYSFHWQDYLPTWAWYAGAIVLGSTLLRQVTFLRVAAAAVAGPTSFFVLSNFMVWMSSAMYAKTLSGLGTCYIAALPFYRNDLISTGLVLGVALGLPALVRRMNETPLSVETGR